jgi:hypothetical protein
MTFFRVACVLLALIFAMGCSSRPKHPRPATQVEEEFKQRWLAQRIAELSQGGAMDTRDARRKATEEFRERFRYTAVAQQVDLVTGAVLP